MTSNHTRARLVLFYAAVALPAVVWGASRALQANNNSPVDWVTSEFAPRAAYDLHCAQFGPGDTVILSWHGCTIDNESVDQLVHVLRTAKVFYEQGDWLFHQVASGREMVKLLTQSSASAESPRITEPDAIARLEGQWIGPDGKTTVVAVTFTSDGLKQRERLVDLIRRAGKELCGVSTDELHMSGPVIDGLSVDVASQETLSHFAGPSAAVVLVLCWLNLRSFRAAAVIFGLAVFCQGATLALVHYSGESMTALLIVLPPLIQVLAVAGGVHLTNYYFDLQSGGSNADRVGTALRNGWMPCTLSAATTAIGMGSLMASELEPIRAFGGYAAAGILLTAGVLLGLLPACYLFWPPSENDLRTPTVTIRAHPRSSYWTAWARVIAGAAIPIATVGAFLVGVGAWYATRLTTSVRIETMFSREHRVTEDYRWLESNVGPLVPLEVTLSYDSSSQLNYRDKLIMLWHIGEQLENEPGLSTTFSAANCFPPIPGLAAMPQEQQDQLVGQLIEASLHRFEQLGLLKLDGAVEHWRLTARTSALGSADYGQMLDRIDKLLDLELANYTVAAKQGLTTNTTGIMPLVHAIQSQLLTDLLLSFVAAFGLITLVMTLVQAGLFSGLLAMLPNVFPLALFFGFLGWRGKPIDIGVVMTASVALGIAVDDTLHFLTFFQRGLSQGRNHQSAVVFALTHCGPAMIQTSVSCGLGMLVFGFSEFLPTSQFAIGMTTLLVLALIGDLVLLPALLLSPLAKLCYGSRQPVLEDPALGQQRREHREAAVA